MNAVRAAIVGTGHWGRNLVRAVQESQELSLVAAYDLNLENLRGLRTPAFTDSDQLWGRSDVEAVLVATPPQSHFALVKAALDSGKHVLCEKPLAMSQRQCLELNSLANSQGLTLTVDCLPVYLDEIRLAKTDVDWTSVRQIRSVRISARRPNHGVSPLWDLAPHDLAVVDFWCDGLPERLEVVSAQPDEIVLRGEYPGRPGWPSPAFELRVGYGHVTERSISISGSGPDRWFAQTQVHPEPLSTVVSHFARCVQLGIPPLTGATTAAATARLLEDVLLRLPMDN